MFKKINCNKSWLLLGTLMVNLCFLPIAFSQTIILVTQEDVDNFDSNISVVNGNLFIGQNVDHTNITDISNLSNLQSVEGKLTIWENDSLKTLTGLESIVYVKDGLTIQNNSSLVDISGLSGLDEINSQLKIYFNHALPNLDGLSNINSIDGGIEIKENDALENIDGLSSIDSIRWDIVISYNDKLKNLDGLSSLKWLQGHLEIIGNDALEDLSGLLSLPSKIKSLSLRGNASLTSCYGLGSIETISQSLSISNCPKLINLSGLNSVKSVGWHLQIGSMANLEEINALNSISTIGDKFSIDSNPKLRNLNGYSNLTSVGGSFRITNNASLANCCGIQQVLGSITGLISIYDNPFLCNNVEAINEATCFIPTISGQVFYDTNGNQIKDEDEYGVPGIEIIENDFGLSHLTNNSGRFFTLAAQDNFYRFAIVVEEGWNLTTDSAEYNLQYSETGTGNDKIDFGVIKEIPLSLANINGTSDETRCNSEVDFFIHVRNYGHQVESGRVVIKLDTNTTYLASSPTMDVEGSELTFIFDALNPFQTMDFKISLDMPTQEATGDVIQMLGEVYYDNENNDQILKDNFKYESIVLCSYDPNDKYVSPVGVKDENYTLFDDELNYTIRFQNTGNAPAIDIRILDIIDQNLDLETFDVTNSSFPVYTTIRGREIEFLFKDIYLLDSITNEEASHGFVNYTIRSYDDLDELTIVNNTAHIIFDKNPAIITNTTKNTLVSFICDDKFTTINDTICEGQDYMGFTETGVYTFEYPIGITCDSFVKLSLEVLPLSDPNCTVSLDEIADTDLFIYPNPTNNITIIYGDVNPIWQLFNIQGKMLQSSNGADIDLNRYKNGIYFIKVKSKNISHVFRIIKI